MVDTFERYGAFALVCIVLVLVATGTFLLGWKVGYADGQNEVLKAQLQTISETQTK